MPDTTPIDLSILAAPLDEAAPAGPNLEYDPRFLALEEALRGAPEVEYGGVLTPAVPPDWPAARTLALQLLHETRDLRLAMALARALLALEGVSGLAGALALTERLLDGQWDSVHPQLDPDDGFDPMLRVNVLATLVAPAEVLREVRETALVRVRALGSFSLRDIEELHEAGEASEQARSKAALVEAAFGAADQAELAATAAALQDAQASVQAIEQQLTRRVGVGSALDLAPLAALLARAGAALRERLREAPGPAAGAAQDQAAATEVAVPPAPDRIAGRADVVRTLERLCAWYAEHEPASPVPLLLQRARRLVDKNFVELLQDLAPDGLAQLARASGVQHES